MITIDGKEGGGQILRSALSLALLTGETLRLTHIRGKRKKPGLMRQHLTCVRAAAEISGGAADGAEPGSTELVFKPGAIRAGDYHFAIGTAGSTSLLLQTLLPALVQADGSTTLRLEGGTHNPMAPPYDFLERVFFPRLREMGVEASGKLEALGFYPAGGGRIEVTIEPGPGWQPVDWTARGDLVSRRILIRGCQVPETVGQRMATAAAKALDWPEEVVSLDVREEGPGPGICCLAEAGHERITEISTAFGERGTSAESVGRRAAKGLKNYLGSGAAVGPHLADQLLLPMAVAGGGSLFTMTLTNHIETNMRVIEAFLEPGRFVVRDEEPEGGLIRIAWRP